MFVKGLMKTPVVSISPHAGLDRALIIMRTKLIRHLPVVDGDKMVGIITDRDLRLAMEEGDIRGPDQAPKGMYLPALKKVESIMKRDVYSVGPNDLIQKAVEIMNKQKIGGLPVLDPDTQKIIGMLTETDLLSLLQTFLDKESN